ncbi:MAG: DNA polymerase IV [candidate division Zixibacteria bacterium]|nr:DNA polymerase IV [candidate division Zixibacteria bacterium]
MRHEKRQPVIALVDMNAFLAAVEESMNPLLKGRPVIVGGHPGERGIVICANYPARARGVKFGSMFNEAHKLAPDAAFIRGEWHIYQDYWDQVCRVFYDYTPAVEPVSMDEAYLDLTGCIDDYTDVRGYLQSMKARIWRVTGLNCSIGVGTSKTIAKIASNIEKPNGLVIVEPGDEKSFLSPLPVKHIPGIGHKTVKVLNDFGVEKVRDLEKIPVKFLQDKFGVRGLEFYECAQGRDPRKVKARGKPKTITRETSFHEDVIDRDEIYAHIYYLLERACAELRRLDLKALSGKIKLRYSDFEFEEESFAFEKSSNVESELYEQFKTQYRRLHKRRAALRLVGTTLFRFTPDLAQMSMFAGESERLSEISRSLDSIRARFGYHSVVNGKTLPLSGMYQKRRYGYELRTSSLTK